MTVSQDLSHDIELHGHASAKFWPHRPRKPEHPRAGADPCHSWYFRSHFTTSTRHEATLKEMLSVFSLQLTKNTSTNSCSPGGIGHEVCKAFHARGTLFPHRHGSHEPCPDTNSGQWTHPPEQVACGLKARDMIHSIMNAVSALLEAGVQETVLSYLDPAFRLAAIFWGSSQSFAKRQ